MSLLSFRIVLEISVQHLSGHTNKNTSRQQIDRQLKHIKYKIK